MGMMNARSGCPSIISAAKIDIGTFFHNPDRCTQIRVDRLTGRNKFADLRFAPIELPDRDRPAEQLVDEPDPVGVQHVTLAITGDLLDRTIASKRLPSTPSGLPVSPSILLISSSFTLAADAYEPSTSQRSRASS